MILKNRAFLIKIREEAEMMAYCDGAAPLWVRAYLDLADAIDRLDAMNARTGLSFDGSDTLTDPADWWKGILPPETRTEG